MISIRQAAQNGIQRLRVPHWRLPNDHIKIDIIDGKPGPWLHLYSELNEEINGRNPCDILNIGVGAIDDEIYEPYPPCLEPEARQTENGDPNPGPDAPCQPGPRTEA